MEGTPAKFGNIGGDVIGGNVVGSGNIFGKNITIIMNFSRGISAEEFQSLLGKVKEMPDVISDKHHDDTHSLYNIDSELKVKLKWFLSCALEENSKKLKMLKGVNTLLDYYSATENYRQKEDKDRDFSMILNEMVEKLIDIIEDNFIKGLVAETEIIQLERQAEKERSVERVISNLSFSSSPMKPYFKFFVKINEEEVYSTKFIFLIHLYTHITELKFTTDEKKGKSIDVKKLRIGLQFSLLQMEFSDLISGSSEVPLKEEIRLSGKDFEIQNLSLKAKTR